MIPPLDKPLRYVYNRTELYPRQEAAMFDEHRYSCIEATVKSGKTSGGIVWIGEKALASRPGRNFWWVAPIFAQTKIAFDRSCDAMTRQIRRPNLNELRLDMINGCRIWFKSADNPDSLYGEDVDGAVVDEASRMKEESWHAVRSTLTATRGQARLFGNVRGRRNWFYRLCRRAESGDADMGYHKITWRDAVAAGILEEAEIDDARSQLPPMVFQELYEAEASDDQGNPFGIEAIRACIIPKFSAFPIAAWGWDLGKRMDWTVGTALDRAGDEVKRVRFQAPWRETRSRIIEETQGRSALVDATGVGDPVVEDLQASGGNFEGYVFTSRTKQMLMDRLAIAIQQREIGLTPGVTVSELEAFEYVYTRTGVKYSAPEGMHDDCVCSLALAKWKLGNKGMPFVSSRVPRSDALGDMEPIADAEEMRVRRSWEDRTGLI